MKNEIVLEKKGNVFTSSVIVSEKADVQHESVVRLINNNLDDLKDFGDIVFSDLKSGKRGRPTRVYYLNEQQATLILTYLDNTEPVKRFKKNLVKAFFEMRKFIKSRHTARLESRELTDAVQLLHDPAMHYHYTAEFDMINRIVLGMSSKQFRLQHGIPKDSPIRDRLSFQEIDAIQRLQAFDAHLAKVFPDYRQRQGLLWEYFEKISLPQPRELTGS